MSARAGAIAAAAIRMLAVSGCAMQLWGCSAEQPPVLFPGGPAALATRDLLFTAAGLMLIVVIPVFLLTAFVVWRYRAGASTGRYTPDWGFSWPIDIIVWTVPLAVVATLGVLVWSRTHQLDPYRAIAAPAAPMVVEVVALDWKWLFIYPEPNIASVNRLVFPAGRDVMLKITSDTVMNAFAIPALGGQIYAMAGMQTQLNLLADAPGTFEGHNTQFSGKGFAQDRFVAEAVTQQNFAAFVARAQQVATRLDSTTYQALARPSIGAPEQLFGGVDESLFSNIIGKYEGKVTLPVRSPDIAPQP